LAGAEIGVAIFATLCQRRQEASAFLLTFDLLELNGSDLPSYRRGLDAVLDAARRLALLFPSAVA
jgi:hypothetical protein